MMVFSLHRRFLLFLLVPVTLIFLVAGVASFFYARAYLLDEWTSSAELRLEKAAHEIQMHLDHNEELINLVAGAEGTPDGHAVQAFLVERLSRQEGVLYVELRSVEPADQEAGHSPTADRASGAAQRAADAASLRQMGRSLPKADVQRGPVVDGQACGHGSRWASLERVAVCVGGPESFMTIVRTFDGADGHSQKMLVLKLSFDSIMQHVLEISQWKSGYACLVKSDGTYLAHTGPAMFGREKLGDTGNQLEARVLKEMQKKHVGTVRGEGHPPEWAAGFYKVPGTDWYLVLFSKGSVVLGPVARFRDHYLLGVLASLVCIGLLVRWNLHPVAKSIGEISEAAAQVEMGDYRVSVPEDRSDEIGQLKRRFNRMIVGLREREFIEHTFGRYVDKKIAEELMRRPEALDLGGKKHVVTILMADLRGFTQVAEKLESEQVIKVLNRYFARMIDVIERYRGIIVDFFGDSILVFFDGLEPDIVVRASDAVKCALEMQRELAVVSRQNEKEGLPRLAMGIGIHTGEVVVGNIGSETRAKYGIVGSPVNETDRIQSFAIGGTTVISEQTYRMLGNRIVVGEKLQAELKGLEGHWDLYEVKSIDGWDYQSTS